MENSANQRHMQLCCTRESHFQPTLPVSTAIHSHYLSLLKCHLSSTFQELYSKILLYIQMQIKKQGGRVFGLGQIDTIPTLTKLVSSGHKTSRDTGVCL